jgi:hypothetical protein
VIDPAKLEALRGRLELRHPLPEAVPFKTGATVWVERRVVVRSAAGAVVVYREDELSKVYELAARPLGPPMQADDLPDLDALFGADPPY